MRLRGIVGGLLLLVALRPAGAAQAQGIRVRPGFEAGVGLAQFTGKDAGDVANRTGLHAGGVLTFDLGRYLSIEPGLFYATEGSNLDAGAGVTLTYAFDYVEIPLRFKLSAPLAPNKRIRPFFYAGPSLGLESKCRLKVKGGPGSGFGTVEADCDDPTLDLRTKSTQVSLHLGAGLDIGVFTIGLRYQLGLTSLEDDFSPADVRNRVVALVIGAHAVARH